MLCLRGFLWRQTLARNVDASLLNFPNLSLPPHTHASAHAHTRQDFSGRAINPSQMELPTQHTTNTRNEHPCRQRASKPWSQHRKLEKEMRLNFYKIKVIYKAIFYLKKYVRSMLILPLRLLFCIILCAEFDNCTILLLKNLLQVVLLFRILCQFWVILGKGY